MDVTLGLGSLIGGIFSGWGQRSAAEKQLQAQRETNEQNYKIWQEQKEHNVDMYNMEYQGNLDMYNLQHRNNVLDWRMQQEYNTASAQRQRLEDAGLNPYLMMNGGNAGYATSAPASASASSAQVNPSQAPTMETAHPSAFTDPISSAVEKIVQSFEGLNVGLNQGASAKATEETTPAVVNNIEADTDNKKANTDKTKSETTGINIDNTYKDKKNAVEFDLLDKQAKLLEDDVLIRNMTFRNRVVQSNLVTSNMMLDNETKSLALQFMPAEKFANLELLASQVGLNVAQKKLTYKQGVFYLASAFDSYQSGKYYGSLFKQQDMMNQVTESGLQYQKDANRDYWATEKLVNSFEFTKQRSFNRAFNKKLSVGYNIGEVLLNNSLLHYELTGNYLSAENDAADAQTGWFSNLTRVFGDQLRNVGGGILGGSVGFNYNGQLNNTPKSKRRIGFFTIIIYLCGMKRFLLFILLFSINPIFGIIYLFYTKSKSKH